VGAENGASIVWVSELDELEVVDVVNGRDVNEGRGGGRMLVPDPELEVELEADGRPMPGPLADALLMVFADPVDMPDVPEVDVDEDADRPSEGCGGERAVMRGCTGIMWWRYLTGKDIERWSQAVGTSQWGARDHAQQRRYDGSTSKLGMIRPGYLEA
jgi:hypothetical protein